MFELFTLKIFDIRWALVPNFHVDFSISVLRYEVVKVDYDKNKMWKLKPSEISWPKNNLCKYLDILLVIFILCSYAFQNVYVHF